MLDDDVHSIDYAASAIFEQFPNSGVMSALSIVLEADRTGIAIIGRGPEQHMTRCRQMLCAWGLKAEVVVSPNGNKGFANPEQPEPSNTSL